MKLFAYLWLSTCLDLLTCLVGVNNYLFESENFTSLGSAMAVLVEKFASDTNRLDVRVHGTMQGFSELNTLLSPMQKVPVNIMVFPTKEIIWREINESAIFLAESQDFMGRSYSNHLKRDHYKPLRFFVYIRGATINTMRNLIYRYLKVRQEREEKYGKVKHMSDIINYQYFIIDDKTSVKLYTFVWYSESLCDFPKFVQINHFPKAQNQWINSQFEIKKFRNFHACDLVFSRAIGVPPGYSNASYLLDFIDAMKTSLNFSYEINPAVVVRDDFMFLKPKLLIDVHITHHQLMYHYVYKRTYHAASLFRSN